MTAPIAGVLETIVPATTGVITGVVYQARPLNRAFLAFISGTGALTATVLLECSMDGVNFATRQTLSLSGSGYAAQAYNDQLSPFPFVRASVTAISGTGASVTVQMAGSNP